MPPTTRSKSMSIGDILDSDPPNLRWTDDHARRTNSTAWHSSKTLIHDVLLWPDFDSDVEKWTNEALNKVGEEGKDTVLCGLEITVQGRVIALITKPVDDLLKSLGYDCETSDFAIVHVTTRNTYGQTGEAARALIEKDPVPIITKNPQFPAATNRDLESALKELRIRPEPKQDIPKLHYLKKPDVVSCRDRGQKALLVGEIKTPWQHLLLLLASLYNPAEGHDRRAIQDQAKKWVGQLAGYLQDMGLRYGYLLTYRDAVFVKLIRNESSEWTLAVSPVVFSDGARSIERLPASVYPGGVSKKNIRTALFALLAHCSESGNANTPDLNKVRIILDKDKEIRTQKKEAKTEYENKQLNVKYKTE